MYADSLNTLYLNKSKLIIKDSYGVQLPYEAEVQDYCNLYLSNNIMSPDFYVEGFYRKVEGANGQFLIAPGGPDTLYITGVSRHCNSLTPFRIKGVSYSSYWEQLDKGYLFQIINNNIINHYENNSVLCWQV